VAVPAEQVLEPEPEWRESASKPPARELAVARESESAVPPARLQDSPSKGAAKSRRSGVWEKSIHERGLEIERRLGGKLPDGFPTVDKWSNGTATSIKSIDLNAPTHQNPGSLQRVLNGHVDKVAPFTGRSHAGVTIRADQVVARELQIAVPSGATTASHGAVLSAVSARAQTKGVTVILREVD